MPCIIKHRFPKTYRIAELDKRIRTARTKAEAKAIVKCGELGLNVPTVLFVDQKECKLWIELLEGKTLKEYLPLCKDAEEVERIGLKLGESIGVMHQAGEG